MNGSGDRRLRVAMVSFDFAEVCVSVANALSRSADVFLILPYQELKPFWRDVGPAVHAVPFPKPRLRQPLRQAAACRTILRTLRRLRPDIVHVQQGHLWLNLLGLPLLPDVPLVLTIHDHTGHYGDGDHKTPQWVMNVAFKRATKVIVHAEQLKREVVERRGLEPDAVHVIPHVEIGSSQQRPRVGEDGHGVLFFGRIWPYKGLDYLIRAEPLITKRVPDARFVIAGKGEDFGRYRGMMRDPSRFTVHNDYVSAEQRAQLFAEAAVVVLPYVEASQSGVVPLAYSFEKPVVATAVGGLPEAVEHGRTGLVVPPRDEPALADSVARLLEDRALRREMGLAGRRKLEREWSAVSVAERTLHVYEIALRQRALDLREAA
jgi:glycosyltransferase involved in cell wall biosynthesis